jgi:hypothetical protein
MRLVAALAAALALVALPVRAEDDVPPDEDPSRWLKELDLEAGSAEADLRLRELDLRDGVKVRLPPYYLRADRIHLSLGKWGVRVKGFGLLTFCPCEDPPVAVGFTGGWAGPPDELIVENPTLRILGLPVLWLPYLWLRSPRKIGLTTPDISFRGPDGLFLGQGVHLPIGHGLELGAGAYVGGGFALRGDLATERSTTNVRFDFRRASDVGDRDVPSGAGLAIDSHGIIGKTAWDIDALRGARAVRTTLDLDSIARPYDHADGIARVGPVAFGFSALDVRGAPIDTAYMARPWVGLAASMATGTIGATQGSIAFGPRFVASREAETIADASLAQILAAPLGAASMDIALRADGRVGRSGERLAAGVLDGRAELSLPLARAYALQRAAGGPPVIHVIEPLIRASAVHAAISGERQGLSGFVAAPAFAESARSALLGSIGARTALGTAGLAPGRDPWIGKLAGEIAAGVLLTDRRAAALSSELSFTTRHVDGGSTLIALQGAGTRALDDRRGYGWLVAGRTRWLYSRTGFGAELRGAARGDLSVLAGWALLGAELAPRLTTATGLNAAGATYGAGTAFPLGFGFRIGADVDVYGTSTRALFDRGGTHLLDVRGTLRYRHPCGCFRMAIRGGHVVGREGVDIFASFELAKTDPNDPRDF